jgi:hypothetical protein
MRGYETSMPLFDRPAQPAPAVPCNPSVPDADVARVTAQQVRILARLRQGPATGPELARIAARFSGTARRAARRGRDPRVEQDAVRRGAISLQADRAGGTMSYLVDMLKPSKENEFDTYVMHINRFGESIVYKLDPDGPPKTFVTGTVDETLGYPLKGSLTAYRVVKLGPEGKQPHYPFAYGLGRCALANLREGRQRQGREGGTIPGEAEPTRATRRRGALYRIQRRQMGRHRGREGVRRKGRLIAARWKSPRPATCLVDEMASSLV